MVKICIVVLIGLPAAGKSSFCKILIQKLTRYKDYQCHNIIYDDIIKINKPNFHDGQYKKLRSQSLALVEDKITSILSGEALKRHVIIIDDNMYYRSMRYEYYKLAKKHKTSLLQIYINIPLDSAVARNKEREEKLQVPESIICDMSKKLEAPGNEHWEMNSFTFAFDSVLSETSLTIVFDALNKCIELPILLPKKENKTGTVPATKLQYIDLLLRKIIHTKIKQNRSRAELYNQRKRDIFQKIKDSDIVIGEEWDELQTFSYLENLF